MWELKCISVPKLIIFVNVTYDWYNLAFYIGSV